MFPNDAITYHTEISGAVNDVFFSGDSTVLSVALQQSNVSSDTEVLCGNDVIAKNYATNFSNVPMQYECFDDDLVISKTGNDNVSAIVTYVPYLMSEKRPNYEPSFNQSTSTDVHVYGNISSGDILIGTLVFFLIFIELLKMITRALDRVKTKKKYLGYHGGDVEVREDI